MSWKGFDSLDLSNVTAGSGTTRLPVGTHHVKCTDAEVVSTASGGKMIKATLEAVDGTGEIAANFNVANKNPQAVDIGMRQLKTFLVAAAHPNPDKPEDIASLKGLSAGWLSTWARSGKAQTAKCVVRLRSRTSSLSGQGMLKALETRPSSKTISRFKHD